jgi:aspartyl-tRNA synthetase
MELIKRTVNCGELRAGDAGKTVTLNGWVDAKRDHGGISFISLRDRSGVLQLVVDSEQSPGLGGEGSAAQRQALGEVCGELRNEFCIAASGIVRVRPDSMVNRDMPTGDIEVLVSTLVILGRCSAPR